jgi:hypothetical protein
MSCGPGHPTNDLRCAAGTLVRVTQPHKDYSGTPLPKKLGIRPEARVLLDDAPQAFRAMLEPLPAGVSILSRAAKDLDVIIVFATEQQELARRFEALLLSLGHAGRMWVAWPKKAGGVPTDITFASAQGIGLNAGLVDNKSASITDVFQGLQFVYRLKDRPKPR